MDDDRGKTGLEMKEPGQNPTPLWWVLNPVLSASRGFILIYSSFECNQAGFEGQSIVFEERNALLQHQKTPVESARFNIHVAVEYDLCPTCR
ncbi:hypothetical protein GN956_G9955 [Arapaima gigas]